MGINWYVQKNKPKKKGLGEQSDDRRSLETSDAKCDDQS